MSRRVSDTSKKAELEAKDRIIEALEAELEEKNQIIKDLRAENSPANLASKAIEEQLVALFKSAPDKVFSDDDSIQLSWRNESGWDCEVYINEEGDSSMWYENHVKTTRFYGWVDEFIADAHSFV